MPFPAQREIEVPLLNVLVRLGGSAAPRQVYDEVGKSFPNLTEEDLQERLPKHPSHIKWWNLVQWTRQRLVEQGQIDGSTRGIWKVTDAGLSRIRGERKPPPTTPPPAPLLTLQDQVNANLDDVRTRIVAELKALTPGAFEHFCMVFLQALGYESVQVTGRTGDRGIDGHGVFRQGAVSIKSAFQAKRFSDAPVGRPEIDKFRGAIQGEFDHGVFLTTSRFAKPAIEASFRKGAITIMLLDGPAIARQMIQRGIGVTRQPVYLLDLDPDFFDFSAASRSSA